MTLLDEVQAWTTACAYDHLIPGRGVGVLLDDGTRAALFRLDNGSVHAVGNVDPFCGAAVMSAASSVTAAVAWWFKRPFRSRLSRSMTVPARTTRAYRCRYTRCASTPRATSRLRELHRAVSGHHRVISPTR